MGKLCVLRIGHRMGRDQRVTTHVFLVARALGATEGVLCGDEDDSVIEGIARVCELWGGAFPVKYENDWKKVLRERKKAGWKAAHLTMYGEDFERGIGRGLKGDWVVIVGAGKVPIDAYRMSDLNLAVTNQPHSEIAALALFLDRFFSGKELRGKFAGKIKIIPNARGKTVVEKT